MANLQSLMKQFGDDIAALSKQLPSGMPFDEEDPEMFDCLESVQAVMREFIIKLDTFISELGYEAGLSNVERHTFYDHFSDSFLGPLSDRMEEILQNLPYDDPNGEHRIGCFEAGVGRHGFYGSV